ncbi:MAG: regulatory protein RecX [Bacteroidota bacterium]
MLARKKLSKEEALQKAKHYCDYQHRCHSEVKDKLYSLGVWKNDVEEIIAQLIEEKYLDEERFAVHFARGRFNLKQWGKEKIKYELKQKHVSEYCIKKALGTIDQQEYENTLQKLAQEKTESLKKERNIFARKKKLRDYLIQKGYEFNAVQRVVEEESI